MESFNLAGSRRRRMETIEFEEEDLPEEPARKNVNELEARLSIVETELESVKESLAKLIKDLMG